MNTELKLRKLDFNEAYRYLGCKSNIPDEHVLSIMNECEEQILEGVRPRYVFRVFDIEKSLEGIIVSGTNICLTGNSIKKHLYNCKKAVFMAVTLSDEADRLIRKKQITDIADAVIMDSLCSVAVEQACDIAENTIKEQLPEYYQTFRFGLGYGDLPIELQNDFIKVINADKLIGLHTNSASMLVPTKSVTAIIGLSSEQIRGQARGCQTCNMYDTCKFREKGGHCNG